MNYECAILVFPNNKYYKVSSNYRKTIGRDICIPLEDIDYLLPDERCAKGLELQDNTQFPLKIGPFMEGFKDIFYLRLGKTYKVIDQEIPIEPEFSIEYSDDKKVKSKSIKQSHPTGIKFLDNIINGVEFIIKGK